MSLIPQLDIYQTQLRSTQFTNEVCFVKGLAKYKENMTLITWIMGQECPTTRGSKDGDAVFIGD